MTPLNTRPLYQKSLGHFATLTTLMALGDATQGWTTVLNRGPASPQISAACLCPMSSPSPRDLGRGHLAVPVLGRGVATHFVLGHQPKLSLQRSPLTGSPEPPMRGPNFTTASTGRKQGVRGALWSLIPADCRSCGHHKPRSYYLLWAQGWWLRGLIVKNKAS